MREIGETPPNLYCHQKRYWNYWVKLWRDALKCLLKLYRACLNEVLRGKIAGKWRFLRLPELRSTFQRPTFPTLLGFFTLGLFNMHFIGKRCCYRPACLTQLERFYNDSVCKVSGGAWWSELWTWIIMFLSQRILRQQTVLTTSSFKEGKVFKGSGCSWNHVMLWTKCLFQISMKTAFFMKLQTQPQVNIVPLEYIKWCKCNCNTTTKLLITMQ